MFRSEIRFYRQIAPVIGVRVPACYRAEDNADGTLLVLEDLSAWAPGAEPVDHAGLLARMHERWRGETGRWPWLRPVGAAAELVAALYDEVWPTIAAHPVLTERVREVGARLVGHAADAESMVGAAAGLTRIAERRQQVVAGRALAALLRGVRRRHGLARRRPCRVEFAVAGECPG